MPEDNARNRLRVGGWIPPYSPGGDPTGEFRPTPQPALTGWSRPREQFARVRESGTLRPRLVLAAALCLACAATAAVAVVLDAARAPEPVAAEFTFPQDVPAFDITPTAAQTPTDVPVSVAPSPSATSLSATPTRAWSSPPPTSAVATRTTTAAPKPTKTTPAPVSLAVGSTVGLEAADRPGHRVRHYDFRARLDPIGSTGRDKDKADSGFRVRDGLAGNGCVSLESVNFPGYYLRHRNYEIRLDRIDGTRLFREDATFCTVTIREGAALALRSTNFPSHHVVAERDRLKIVETTAARATAFIPRPAL